MAVDTKRVAGRRKVHFDNYEQLLADVRDLAGRPTRQLGNWSLGQICHHIAAGLNTAIDGAPFNPPWILRKLGPLFKKRAISRPLSPGFKLPRQAGSLIPQSNDAAEGIAAIEQAVARLDQTPERQPHVIFGSMTSEEWDQFQLRHAEMHLSFIVPE